MAARTASGPNGAGGATERVLADEAATRAYAADLARRLPRGALLLLDGPLGAGKTTLIAGLAVALGSEARVSSPTYTLIHEYPTPAGVLVHVDAYRLDDPVELLDLGLDDYLDRARLVAIEWGGPLAAQRPEAWRLTLERPFGGGAGRIARLVPGSP